MRSRKSDTRNQAATWITLKQIKVIRDAYLDFEPRQRASYDATETVRGKRLKQCSQGRLIKKAAEAANARSSVAGTGHGDPSNVSS